MTFLVDILPAGVRKYVYAAYALAGLVLGAVALTPYELAPWIPAVYAFVGTALGLTAYANTNRPPSPNASTLEALIEFAASQSIDVSKASTDLQALKLIRQAQDYADAEIE